MYCKIRFVRNRLWEISPLHEQIRNFSGNTSHIESVLSVVYVYHSAKTNTCVFMRKSVSVSGKTAYCMSAENLILLYRRDIMQILGYFITSVGTMLLLWYCCEKLFAPRRHTILATGFCFVFAAVLSIAQTWLLFDKNLNSLTNIVIFFALTFLYSKPWTQRLFIAFLLFVLSVLGEGSGCLFVQILYGIDLKDVNETILFPIICLLIQKLVLFLHSI